jgi:hypothetical protein
MEKRSNLQEEKQQLITRWQQSGLSQAAFCRRESIPFAGFYYWQKKLCKPQKKIPGKFLKIIPSDSLTSGIFAEVVLPTGSRITFHKAVSLKELKQLTG